jgi:hypothetical protein
MLTRFAVFPLGLLAALPGFEIIARMRAGAAEVRCAREARAVIYYPRGLFRYRVSDEWIILACPIASRR